MATTARNYTSGVGIRKPIRIIVLHSAENQQLDGQAEHLVQWFAGKTAPQASAHYMVDNKIVAQSVDDDDVAWATGVWANNLESISIEMTGQAAFTAEQWANPYSVAVINQTASLARRLGQKYSIPPVHLTVGQILDGKTKGYCTHADITAAYKVMGGHTDPGPNFPVQKLLDMIKG